MEDDVAYIDFIRTNKYTGQVETKNVYITYLAPWRTLKSEIEKHCVDGWEPKNG